MQIEDGKVGTFIEFHGDIYVRAKLRTPATTGSGPNFVCQACGWHYFSNSFITVAAGPDQWHAITYEVCPDCVKGGAIDSIERDHPGWYIRIQS